MEPAGELQHEAGAKVSGSPPANSGAEDGSSSSPKKRRKVNQACVYCRRSERPCTRCVKRNIGHLCHDERRENVKRAKGDLGHTAGEDEPPLKQEEGYADKMAASFDQQQSGQPMLQDSGLNVNTPSAQLVRNPNTQLAQATSVSSVALSSMAPKDQFPGYNDWNIAGQNPFHDMHTFHPSYMFHAPEVNNEYNLLNDFLSTSLLDDEAMYQGEVLYSGPTTMNNLTSRTNGGEPQYLVDQQRNSLLPPPALLAARDSNIARPPSTKPNEKARETYFMTAADPQGSETPAVRMRKLLDAKVAAGMLKPFNYVKGYARLNQYMDQYMQPNSRQKILRQLDKFRPKFRVRMQSLTDYELVLVEMWFEQCLMEYDRVFASMAIPACCWRRTGEIFRGNKEMAELIHVPIEKLRDGKLAIHEIIVEDHLVSYWEKFGGIAFDNTQKAMLTSCSLKNPDHNSVDPTIECCFSFTVRRDDHDM
ncbi:MAG: hypothetical protein MMC33_002228 [Icmadophila ericetorum]|nr:hypothetical protein [Icmadophila ericetorum]